MRITFNLFLSGVLILGAVFLYSSFKKINFEEKNNEEAKEKAENILPALADGWKQYKNEEYNFSVQYPQEWEIGEKKGEQKGEQKADVLEEINLQQKKDENILSYISIKIFKNNNLSLSDWWNNFLAEEDQKKNKCREEDGPEAPCLFLRDLIENQENATLFNLPAKKVQVFQFDSSKECNFIVSQKNVYEICYDKINPNDSNFEENKKLIQKVFSTFSFGGFSN